ncbi:MAG: glycosyltransferase family 2 protein [Erysipelotrichaceae bacterium]|nr:glycosyltransferase family 2 protein [Erysipelotrichaceae bacterium]
MKTKEVPLISVIVPVFNIEDYIERCLNSLQAQTMKDIEIIVIDDGSTDSSGKICDKFAEEDPRFKIIHKDNEGLSAARNDGLDISKGKYIMFVDGDDWVEPEFCEAPYSIAEETDAEIVIFEWANHNNDDHKTLRWFSNIPFRGFTEKRDLFAKRYDSISVVVWNKMYNKKLFEEIRFPVGRFSEDNVVTHKLIHNAYSIFLLDEVLYHNQGFRPNSIITERSKKLLIDQAYYIFLRRLDLFKWGYIEIERVADAAISYLVRVGRNSELSDQCDCIIRKSHFLTNNSIAQKKKIMIIIYKISPLLFDLICDTFGERVHDFPS